MSSLDSSNIPNQRSSSDCSCADNVKNAIIANFINLQNIGGPEWDGFRIDANLKRDYKDSPLYVHYLLAPLVLCDHPFYEELSTTSTANKDNQEYIHGVKLYEDLFTRASFMTTFREHEQYLSYLFWKLFLPLKGKGDIFRNRPVPPKDVPRNQEDQYEFLQQYLPSIRENEISDLEQVLLAIRNKKYTLTESDYFDIVEPVIKGRQQKQIYLNFLIQRQKQWRMDKRFRRSLGEIQDSTPEMLLYSIADIAGLVSPVYNLRNRVVDRDEVRVL